MKKTSIVLNGVTALIFTLTLSVNTYAQTIATGHAVAVSTDQEIIPNGSVISNSDAIYTVATKEYDSSIFGVSSDEPSTYIDDTTAENKALVITHGEAFVRVTNTNGDIVEGDYLTSSNIPGVAQKATRSGAVLAVALDSFNAEEGLILAFVDVGPQFISSDAQTNLFSTITEAFNSPFVSPLVSLRYLLAAIIIISSFIISFMNFRRISGSSIEALGRNPLAKDIIRSTVILNFIITSAILLVGIVLTVVILIL